MSCIMTSRVAMLLAVPAQAVHVGRQADDATCNTGLVQMHYWDKNQHGEENLVLLKDPAVLLSVLQPLVTKPEVPQAKKLDTLPNTEFRVEQVLEALYVTLLPNHVPSDQVSTLMKKLPEYDNFWAWHSVLGRDNYWHPANDFFDAKGQHVAVKKSQVSAPSALTCVVPRLAAKKYDANEENRLTNVLNVFNGFFCGEVQKLIKALPSLVQSEEWETCESALECTSAIWATYAASLP